MPGTKVIVNPVAGNGKAARLIPQVEKLLKKHAVDFDIVLTTEPWHAASLAGEAASQGYDTVAAMGGDGTMNEVLNGLMMSGKGNKPGPALAVLEAGRGNDFAFGAGIPDSLERDCSLLARGQRHTIDVGRVFVDDAPEGRYFGNGIGIGFDTMVGFEAATYKHLSGFAGYLVAGIKTLFFYYKPPEVTIRLDGETISQPSLMISVMNGRRMGGGFLMAPDGRPDDGKLDYCIVSYGRRLRLLGLMINFIKGTQAGEKEVSTGRTQHIEITAESGTLPAHADGETLCRAGTKLGAEIVPAGLDIILPAEDAA